MAYYLSEQHEPALAMFEALLERFPDDPFYTLYVGMSEQGLGNLDEYDATVASLLERLDDDHALVPELLCRRAFALRRAGAAADGRHLAEAACARGFVWCCEGAD
jgi:tetratricopeptide (TPR) repeat protein